MPPFPSYNTFSNPTDSLLDATAAYQGSYGSLGTDHTGRSLDTLEILSVRGEPDNNEDDIYEIETTQVQIETADATNETTTNSTS